MYKPYIVGITGGSGSGKTTFLKSLSEGYSAEEVCILSMDNYYKPRTQQVYDENGVQNFDLVESIDTQAFFNDIIRLVSGETIVQEEYTFNNSLADVEMITIKPAPVMILEGLFIMHMKDLRSLLDLKIYIEAKDALKIIRRIKRDQSERNYPLEDVLYRYESHVLPSYEKYIFPYKNDVDIIINNNGNTDAVLNILRNHFDVIINSNQ
ncbi:MAG: deoxynucleoside kinase [Saprospiraceae bacterium]|jgi:uridine kinase|nr:deoxynucleoside kinase [Saprospiraceae bacterium]MBX7179133.1 deoxynucleoside kinase [Saprospiraceae bacterium]MCB0589908.1 deoxynucleoside kinase [Saprospiraceae bacterium]MCO5283364.1 deoxynucleoside kinase [Saprospiraceae bacterium]MCO6470083.1 deoxynucleoside kinase [Saprospiraceae bacterium]